MSTVTLAAGLTALGIALPEVAQLKLLAFRDLLLKWNRTYNLTALRDPQQAISHHLLDALAILPHIGAGPLLDVGSGGGLPGIPLAIARPDLSVTLVDTVQKKASFLQQAAIELGLPNISVHCGRVEQYHPSTGYAAIASRAFSALAAFAAMTRHLLAADGCWLAMKGIWPEDEIAHLPANVRVDAAYRLRVPGVEGERHLVVMREAGAES